MGLSASSLRLAMLTARKSNLEFEAQQINQQRMNLSNQSAAIYNDMLSMSVPTPPNANEFTKEVYTFNKGNGVSQLLSTTRNSSGPYDYDVLYKTPKTEDVLMKKQLNNVGFKYNNDQMTANIDGVDYALTLNGNEDKLNDYIKTQKTYENIKNVESQMQSLWSLSPDKELSSSQMKQYFETLGLSTYETPASTQVLDVETMDDAFQNVYNEGNAYEYEDVTLNYTASTPPQIARDESKRNLLKLDGASGTLTQGEDNEHYTFDSMGNEECPFGKYTISRVDGNWVWSLQNPTGSQLSYYGIKEEAQYDNIYTIDDKVASEFTNETINNVEINGDNVTWHETTTYNEGDSIEINGNIYTPTLDGNCFSMELSSAVTDALHGLKAGSSIIFYDSNGATEITSTVVESEYGEGYSCKFKTEFGTCDYFINSAGLLTINSKKPIGFYQDLGYYKHWSTAQTTEYTEADLSNGYWYNFLTGEIGLKDGMSIDRDPNSLKYESKCGWGYVDKQENGMYIFSLQLTQDNISGEAQISETPSKIYEGNNYNYIETINNERIYTRTVEREDGSTYTEMLVEYSDGKYALRYDEDALCQKEGLVDITKIESGYQVTERKSCKINEFKEQTDLDIVQKPAKEPNGKYKFVYYGNSNFQGEGKDLDFVDGKVTFGDKDQYTLEEHNNNNGQTTYTLSGTDLGDIGLAEVDLENDDFTYEDELNGVNFKVIDYGDDVEENSRYSITATFKAWVTGEPRTWGMDDKQDGYSYDKKNHTVSLTTPAGVTAQMLLRNQNNNRHEDDKNITVNEMLAFYEAILEQFKFFGTSTAYKTKLDTARENYISTIDAKGVETPGENEVIYNFIDQNGNEAYLYVPLSCVNTNGQIDSTYAYMLETSYIEGQTETISQKANIIYDENGRIAKICFDDGTVVMPEITVEQDDEAYEAAMVKYDYERAKYEKALSDCNTKTQIIQEQDKKLELQLKSIDTEHTAIQTELEAVKKVLDSNIKSSFGTFNA